MGVASDATNKAHDALSNVRSVVADAPHQLASGTRGNPLAVGLIAFGVGLPRCVADSGLEGRAASG